MPYNPQVQYMGPQIKMQGMDALAQGLAQGIQQFQQNRQLTAANIGKFWGAAKATPELLEIFAPKDQETSEMDSAVENAGASWKAPQTSVAAPPSAMKAFAKLQKGQTPTLEESSVLAHFADTYSQEMQAKTQNELRKAQAAQLAQETAASQAALAQSIADKAAFTKSLRPFTLQGATERAVQRGVPFSQLPSQAPQFDAPQFMQGYFQEGGSPQAIDKIDVVLKAMSAPTRQQGTVMSAEQYNALRRQGLNAKGVPLADGSFLVTAVNPFAPAPSTTVNIPSENEYGKTVGKLTGERQVKEFTDARDAAAHIEKLDQTIDLLQKGDPTTGVLAELRNNVNRAIAGFGSLEARKKVTDTQLLDAMLGSDVFPMIGALNIGARGLDTPAEREFLRKVMTGDISLDKNTLIKMTEMRRKMQERAINTFNKGVEAGEYDRFFKDAGLNKQSFKIPEKRAETLEDRLKRY